LIEEALTASLVEDGLADPLVALASARTGAGVDRIMAELTRHTAHAPAAARRLAADLWRAADRLGEAPAAGDAPSNLAQAAEHLREGTAAGHVPADLPAADRVGEAAAAGHAPGGLPQAPGRSGGAAAPGSEPGGLSAAADRVGEAAAAGHAPGGLPQAPGRLGEATAAGRPAWIGAAAHAVTSSLVEICAPAPSVAPPRAPGAEDTRSAASTWVAEAAVHLPEQWCLALGYALGSPANTATRLKDALAGLELPPEPGFWARLFKRKKAAQARRAEWEKRVRARVAPVVERTMAQPTEVLLADRRNLAQLIAEVRAEAATLGLL
ncbi:MAG: hypothetical protein LBL01_06605, partial [Bifidobacteriaceae bacterium]|nr:hypothetical protein [Bifidobacteriaceae bacterium]